MTEIRCSATDNDGTRCVRDAGHEGLHEDYRGDVRVRRVSGALAEALTVAELVLESHATARSKGWWEEQEQRAASEIAGGASLYATATEAFEAEARQRIPEKVALMHSELSELLEEHRAGRHPCRVYENHTHPGKPEGIPIELADLLIRAADFAGALGIDLEAALRAKLAYNRARPHRHGGKAC